VDTGVFAAVVTTRTSARVMLATGRSQVRMRCQRISVRFRLHEDVEEFLEKEARSLPPVFYSSHDTSVSVPGPPLQRSNPLPPWKLSFPRPPNRTSASRLPWI
jgi:hypothetical protein